MAQAEGVEPQDPAGLLAPGPLEGIDPVGADDAPDLDGREMRPEQFREFGGRVLAHMKRILGDARRPVRGREDQAPPRLETGGGGAQAAEIFKGIQISYAESTQTIFYIMTGVLVVLFFFALVFVPGGKVDKVAAEGSYDAPPSGS